MKSLISAEELADLKAENERLKRLESAVGDFIASMSQESKSRTGTALRQAGFALIKQVYREVQNERTFATGGSFLDNKSAT